MLRCVKRGACLNRVTALPLPVAERTNLTCSGSGIKIQRVAETIQVLSAIIRARQLHQQSLHTDKHGRPQSCLRDDTKLLSHHTTTLGCDLKWIDLNF